MVTLASNPSRREIDSLFAVGRRIFHRRLEGMLVAPRKAAVVSENPLPNLFRSYFWEWWQCGNCKARGSGGRKWRGGQCGRHSKVARSQGSGKQAGSSLIRLMDGATPRGHPTHHNFLEYPIPGVSQLKELHPTQTHEVKDAQVLIPACLVP
jgi:hypothetical protein